VKLNFRQGIVRHQTDVSGNAIFLQRSTASGGQFIDLIVSPDQTILSFAHRASTYIVEELRTVPRAWGPLSGPGTKYLYWDLSLMTGTLTRSITLLPPIYTSSAPTAPAPDQYWFDTVENIGRVFNGTKWVEKLRVFAGSVTSNAVVHPARVGSEAGLVGDTEGGHIVLDSLGSPLRQSNGTFVTTVSWLNVVNLGTTSTRLEEPIMSGQAAEELPQFSLVQLRKGRRLFLARSTDYTTRVSGIITTDMYEGEVEQVITRGVVRSDDWTFTDDEINRPVFCGATGQVTLRPPRTGVLQQVGFVYDVNAIMMDIKQVVVLSNPLDVPVPEIPPTQAPTAQFTASVLSGVAPLVVSFTNTSIDATTLQWDFTNDGFVDETATNPVWTFATPGIYTVRLRAINQFGFDDEIKSNIITVTAPQQGATVNLGLSFNAPTQIIGGAQFAFQVITTNDGLLPATEVQRVIKLRSNNGTAVTITNSPAGTTVLTEGVLTVVSLPRIPLGSGQSATAILNAVGTSSASAIQIEGTAVSPEVDNTPGDNSQSVTIVVKP